MANQVLKSRKSRYALGAVTLLGAALMLFILAANEQSVRSSGLPTPARISLQALVAQGSGDNKHVELSGFYLGKQFIYAAELVQFRDVYLPMFAAGQPETAANLRILLWIRNDRYSNQPLVLSRQDLERLAQSLNQTQRPVTGILRKPTRDVLALTEEAYPGVNREALQLLWARDFPDQQPINIRWGALLLCSFAAAACALAYKREPR